MTGQELREKFLKFFEKNGHTIIPSASLVPSEEEQLSGKEKVLFTSAGMQPLTPYLMGKSHPMGKKLANVQKCLRTDDIEEVGDAVHHTFFEMLGNWSLGDYWKDEAIKLSFEFLTKELEIPLEKLAISVFVGDEDAPKDEESAKVWESLGIPKERIFYFGKEHNWWPTGEKSGLCGPDTEMFIWIGGGDPEGKPNENPSWVEVWNDVFMEFNRNEDGTLEELPQKNVDTGMGLERMLAVLNGKDNDYETDLFEPLLEVIRGIGEYDSSVERIIADHLRASIFLILDGIEPSNKLQGYILRRLLRRAAVKISQTENQELNWHDFMEKITKTALGIYVGVYGIENSEDLQERVTSVLTQEINKFYQTLKRGLQEIKKIEKIDGKKAFDLYQTFGFPYEVTEELFRQKGQEIDKEQFKKEFEKHKELSRTASAGMFKGGLADHSEVVTKYHTATHLLHQALRDVLGPEVFQKGSNITSERLRFDFSFDRKLTDEEIKKAEDIINERISEDLKVDNMTISLEEAKKMNAIGLFDEKYKDLLRSRSEDSIALARRTLPSADAERADKVSIYGVGPGYELDPDAKDKRDRGGYYSLEFCGGPHVQHTGVIGKIKIIKDEAIASGMRRIRAQLI